MPEPKWIRFEQEGDLWDVLAKEDGGYLGMIVWFPRWRCYCFRPFPETIFERQCLRDIAAFCEARTEERRATRRRKRVAAGQAELEAPP